MALRGSTRSFVLDCERRRLNDAGFAGRTAKVTEKRQSPLVPQQAFEEVIAATPVACQEINDFARKVFLTRGGRMGSGMGVLLEALWGYYVDKGRPAREAGNEGWEIGWLPQHEYNDFACLRCGSIWDAATKQGELLRVEAKSMNCDAEESKGHFDELIGKLGPLDLLLVLVWAWKPADRDRVYPRIQDHFIGPAHPIAQLRDELHLARGGSFVSATSCPDGCDPRQCVHDGEPLNASGKRERLSGPESCRPSTKTSCAQNFGGLLRMLKTASPHARRVFRRLRAEDDVVHRYIGFIHRNFPKEEAQYRASDWMRVAEALGVETGRLSREQVIAEVRRYPDYMEKLRELE
jgi:hypothetical protein